MPTYNYRTSYQGTVNGARAKKVYRRRALYGTPGHLTGAFRESFPLSVCIILCALPFLVFLGPLGAGFAGAVPGVLLYVAIDRRRQRGVRAKR